MPGHAGTIHALVGKYAFSAFSDSTLSVPSCVTSAAEVGLRYLYRRSPDVGLNISFHSAPGLVKCSCNVSALSCARAAHAYPSLLLPSFGFHLVTIPFSSPIFSPIASGVRRSDHHQLPRHVVEPTSSALSPPGSHKPASVAPKRAYYRLRS